MELIGQGVVGLVGMFIGGVGRAFALGRLAWGFGLKPSLAVGARSGEGRIGGRR